MKAGVIVFPGSNCDRDTHYVLHDLLQLDTEYIWYRETHTGDSDFLVIPGGFSYGDYLRTGAIAATSPILRALRQDAARGKPVIGICNGFQILIESGMLPGALLTNAGLSFICRDVHLKTEHHDTMFTNYIPSGKVLQVPIAHHTGNYYADEITLTRLEEENRILFRYSDPEGAVNTRGNPNGSFGNIAGILNENRNVLGMMPHPERSSEREMGSDDGLLIFQSIVEHLIGS